MHLNMYFYFFLFFTLLYFVCGANHVIYERCMKGRFHKLHATPEPGLNKCSQFREKSCCTNDTAASIHDDTGSLYQFNYSHCAPMSDQCKKFFLMNNCFYECSPNVWPWLQSVNSSYRDEKFSDVPICFNDCNDWWQACKAESTCVVNWSSDFVWKNKVNECPDGSSCKSFQDIYRNETYFCENVWRSDYKVVAKYSSKPCFKFEFEDKNPNTMTAEFYAKEKGLIFDKSAVAKLESQVSRLKTDVAILAFLISIIVLSGIICLVICMRYQNGSFFSGCFENPKGPQPAAEWNSSDHTGSTDSKVSFVNNMCPDDQQLLT